MLTSSRSNRGYLQSITGNLWYFETVVLLASLLDSKQVSELISVILEGRASRADILSGCASSGDPAYRAILATECLDTSTERRNAQLTGQVFEVLKSCVQDKATAKVDKVECWRALGRLQLGGVQLGELPQMMEDDSRFVREEALKTVAFLSREPLPGCRPAGRRLIWEAAKLFALDRFWQYRKWVFARSLRNFTLTGAFVIATVASFLFWIVPVLITPYMASFLPPLFFWWTMPLMGLIDVFLLEVFLGLNEDKRSLRGCLSALRGAISHLIISDNPIERFRAGGAFCAWIVPHLLLLVFLATELMNVYQRKALQNQREAVKQERKAEAIKISDIGRSKDRPRPVRRKPLEEVTVPDTLDMWAILDVADAIDSAKDLQKYMVSQKLAGDKESIAHLLSNPARRRMLVREIRKLAYLVGRSTEIDYKVEREALAELCSRSTSSESSTEHGLAVDLIYSLRREAREKKVPNHLRFDWHYRIIDKDKYLEQVLPEEVQFLSEVWEEHSYLNILWANGMVSPALLSRAEKSRDEKWFAEASRKLLIESKKLFSGGRPVPRSSMVLAFERLGEAIGHPEAHGTAVQSALKVLKEERNRWIAARREAEEARRRAEEARRRAEEAGRTLRWIVLFILVIVALIVWLGRKVIIYIQLSRKDPSLPEDIKALGNIATEDTWDMFFRKHAVRMLALSDASQARDALRSIINSPKAPEPLQTEAHRALYHQQRRQMRRGSTG